jgi:predicted TPR repeat methyltransferase
VSASASRFAGLLQEAESLHQQGRLTEAETLLQAVLDVDACNFDALNRMGVLRSKQGEYEEALTYLRAALEQDAKSARVHHSIGIALTALKRRDEAIVSYRNAVAFAPDFAEAHVNLGNLLDDAQQTEAAIASYRRALEIKPDLVAGYRNLGATLLRLRKATEAAEVFHRWLAIEPDNQIAAHLYALASGKNALPRAPDAWLEQRFDALAAAYDSEMHKLGYRAPKLVADALARAIGPPRGRFVALDAGCGTGLCGLSVRDYARRLTGVDLSSGMLERAKATDVYDKLYQAELVAYMQSVPQVFDLIVSADTLTFFGALELVLEAAHGAMRTGGLLIFTLEESPERHARGGYRLDPQGRYGHSIRYLRRVLAAAGFAVLSIESATIRVERRRAVVGLVATCERLARPGMRPPFATRLRALRMRARRLARWIRSRAAQTQHKRA